MLGRRRKLGMGAAVVVLVAGGAWWLLAGDEEDADLRAGSELVDPDPAGLLPVGAPPESYRIDYRIEGHGGDDVVTNADRLYVRRPFESRLEGYEGKVPGGEPSSIQVSALGAVRLGDGGQDTIVVASPPAPGLSDVRVAGSLAQAVADDRAELRERRRVAGRECQVVRTAFGFANADLVRPADADDYADTCLDADGLVLEEVVVSDGELLLRRVATDVAVDVELDDELFAVGEPTVATADGGGFFAELVPGAPAPGERSYEPGAAPAGYVHVGRFAVVPQQAERFTDATRRDARLAYVSDVWVDGADLVVLDQGSTLGNVDPFPELEGVDIADRVDVEGARGALLTYSRGGPIVVVDLGAGRFLRARGTGDPDVLFEVLAALEVGEGGELELLEGRPPQPGGG